MYGRGYVCAIIFSSRHREDPCHTIGACKHACEAPLALVRHPAVRQDLVRLGG